LLVFKVKQYDATEIRQAFSEENVFRRRKSVFGSAVGATSL
jgi:hypothetical protein